MRISDWSSEVCSSDLQQGSLAYKTAKLIELIGQGGNINRGCGPQPVKVAIEGLLQGSQTWTVGAGQLRLCGFKRDDGIGHIAAQLQLLLGNRDQMIHIVDEDQI